MSQGVGGSSRKITIRARKLMSSVKKKGDAGAVRGLCDVQDVRRQSYAAIQQGADQIDLDLTTIDNVDAGLISCLVEVMRATRMNRVHLKLVPSVAVNQLLETCHLDDRLQPVPQYAA